MAITGPSSYVPTMNEFLQHWTQCNAALSPAALSVTTPSNGSMTRAQFVTLRDTLLSHQDAVQNTIMLEQVARGAIDLHKVQLLTQFTQFMDIVEAYYAGWKYFNGRPHAPRIGVSQEHFSRPLVRAGRLWGMMNEDPAPPPVGITKPITLADGTSVEAFMSSISGLQFEYSQWDSAQQDADLARNVRTGTEATAYAVMKAYRIAVPPKLANFPAVVESLPRLTPLSGHTPVPVAASAVFEQPNLAHVVYEASDDAQLYSYQLRGNVGDHYDEEDAVVIDTHTPEDPREFTTPFGLTQVGAQVALKVFVVLTTGNEAGSAPMIVERVAQVLPIAA